MKVRIENERKFRVVEAALDCLEDGVEITQSYLSVDPPVRVRVEDFANCFLTIKIKQAPGINLKFEETIPSEAATMLMVNRKYHKIRKTRYKINGLEIDVFLRELRGLVLVKFEKKDDNELVLPDHWVVQEVTGDAQFDNDRLCQLDKLPDGWRCRDVSGSL